MKVTITTLTDFLLTLDVHPTMELENFKALCESETGIPSQEMVVTHQGVPLLDGKRDLVYYGIREGDVLLLQHMTVPTNVPGSLPLNIDFGSIRIPEAVSATLSPSAPVPTTSRPVSSNDPQSLWQALMQNPALVKRLEQNNPRLAEAFQSGSQERFAEILKRQLEERAEHERRRIQMLNSDPFDPEAQRLIAEEIRMDNVDSNMEAAIEYHPESFGQVTMLYINCKVNGHPVKAFIDSGAQTTIMSQACAERCGIMRLVDKRWAGLAKGVGVQKIIGRVHLGQIQINNTFLTSSFSILEDQQMDMLLGLDMLKRHQCCIDLKRDVLVIGTTGTETPFLTENEIPKERPDTVPDELALFKD